MDKNNLSKIRVKLWSALLGILGRDDFIAELESLPARIVASWQPELYYGAAVGVEEVRDYLIAQLGGDLQNPEDNLRSCGERITALYPLRRQFLTVASNVCNGCEHNQILVTDLCRGCRARPCQEACRFGAISMQHDRAYIDQEKCKKCGKCIKVCSYTAIVKRLAPCVNACPVGAVSKTVSGVPAIDFDKCIHCGRCDAACHFGAIVERSQLSAIMHQVKNGRRKVIAMLAPSIVGQLPGSIKQIAAGLVKLGFYKVVEVAVGADETSLREAKEWQERVLEAHDSFMTTSCCTAYTELVKRHVPELERFVSTTLTPMAYIARKMRKQYPEALTVFVGPCVAKRAECFDNEDIDAVMEYEELEALFIASGIVLSELSELDFDERSSEEARNFGLTSGVATAVSHLLDKRGSDLVRPYCVNGLDKAAVQQLKEFAGVGCSEGNLVEIMACAGGCVGGPHAAKPSRDVVKSVREYAASGVANRELSIELSDAVEA